METMWIVHMPQTRAIIEFKLDKYVRIKGDSINET